MLKLKKIAVALIELFILLGVGSVLAITARPIISSLLHKPIVPPVALSDPSPQKIKSPIKPALVAVKKLTPLKSTTPAFQAGGALRATDNLVASTTTLTVAGVLRSTNEARSDNGDLPALRENRTLDAVAERRLDDMFAKQYFAHVSPSGVAPSDVATTVGYAFLNFGENIALGNYRNDATLVTAWMNSPHHRENILNSKYKEIGIGVRPGLFKGEDAWLAVQVFGRPQSDCPAPNKATTATIESQKNDLAMQQRRADELRNQLQTKPSPYDEEAVQSYNQKVSEYNELVAKLRVAAEAINQLIREFNAAVNNFNACLAQ